LGLCVRFQEASQLAGRIECDQPNERLYQFQGRIRFRGDVALPLNADNLLLRVRRSRPAPGWWVRSRVLT